MVLVMIGKVLVLSVLCIAGICTNIVRFIGGGGGIIETWLC